MKKQDFFALLIGAARTCAAASAVPASFTLAQAALESAWGESQLAKQGRNLFGVKADPSWTGSVLTMPTREFINGAWCTVSARWRSYATWQECVDDHAAFFHRNQRYAGCFAYRDGEGFARAVAAAGYATDPEYGNKLVATIRANNLAVYDTPAPPPWIC